MYKSIVSLFSLLSISNGQTSTMTPITYTCGSAEQSANNDISVYLALNYDTEMVYITLTGPSDQYFAVGFGTTGMTNAYTIVVDGDGDVSERKLSSSGAGSSLSSTVTVLSNTVSGDVRTVFMSRAIEVTDSDYFTFGTYDSTSSLNTIWATDDSNSISQHTTSNRGSVAVDNFAEDNGDSDSCGALGSTTDGNDDDDDDDSAVSYEIKTAFGVVLAALPFLA